MFCRPTQVESDIEARIDDILAEEDAEMFATNRDEFHAELVARSRLLSTDDDIADRPDSHANNRFIESRSTDGDIDDDELHELLGV